MKKFTAYGNDSTNPSSFRRQPSANRRYTTTNSQYGSYIKRQQQQHMNSVLKKSWERSPVSNPLLNKDRPISSKSFTDKRTTVNTKSTNSSVTAGRAGKPITNQQSSVTKPSHSVTNTTTTHQSTTSITKLSTGDHSVTTSKATGYPATGANRGTIGNHPAVAGNTKTTSHQSTDVTTKAVNKEDHCSSRIDQGKHQDGKSVLPTNQKASPLTNTTTTTTPITTTTTTTAATTTATAVVNDASGKGVTVGGSQPISNSTSKGKHEKPSTSNTQETLLNNKLTGGGNYSSDRLTYSTRPPYNTGSNNDPYHRTTMDKSTTSNVAGVDQYGIPIVGLQAASTEYGSPHPDIRFPTQSTTVQADPPTMQTPTNSNVEQVTSQHQSTPHVGAPSSTTTDYSIPVTAPFKWTKSRMLGCGAFGKVFLCIDEDNKCVLAVKEVDVDPNWSNDTKKAIELLEKEITILKKVKHDRIVQYYGTERDGSCVRIFMEFMEGGSLYHYIDKKGALEEHVTSEYTRQLLEGVDYLHVNKIVHRDIKGANILMDHKGHNIKIADFGAAKLLRSMYLSVRTQEMKNTSHKSVTGTAYWMAPEVIRGEKIDCKADIWSVGCTVVEMLTCHPPYGHLESIAAMYKIATQPMCCDLPAKCSSHAYDFLSQCFISTASKRPAASTLLKHQFIQMVGMSNDEDTTDSGPVASAEQPQQATDSGGVDSVMTVKVQSETGMDTLTPPMPTTTAAITTDSAGRAAPTNPQLMQVPTESSSTNVSSDYANSDCAMWKTKQEEMQNASNAFVSNLFGNFPPTEEGSSLSISQTGPSSLLITDHSMITHNSLESFAQEICSSVDVQTILPWLIQFGLITRFDQEYLMSHHHTSSEKQLKLMCLAISLNEKYVKKFLECLSKTTGDHPLHGELLEKIYNKNSDKAKEETSKSNQ